MRQFSVNGSQICVYSFETNTLERKKIDEVLFRNYVYGKKSDMEKALGAIETSASRVIKKIVDDPYKLELSVNQYCVLIEFIGSLFARTIRNHDNWKKIIDIIIENIEKKNGDASIAKSMLEEPCTFALHFIGKHLRRLLYLNSCLVVNESDIGFITTDCPVTVYNPVTIRARYPQYSFYSAGVQLLLSLSPKILLVLYDPDYYKLNKPTNLVQVKSDTIIRDINRLLIANAFENYVLSEEHTKEQCKSLVKWRNKNKNAFEEEKIVIDNETPLINHHISVKINIPFLHPIRDHVGMNATYGNKDTLDERHIIIGMNGKNLTNNISILNASEYPFKNYNKIFSASEKLVSEIENDDTKTGFYFRQSSRR